MVWIPQLFGYINTTEIVAWGVNNVAGEVIAGVILIYGIAISVKKWCEMRDKKKIYNWLCGKTNHLEHCTVGSPELTNTWPSTEEISSAVDLTEERVNYICTIDKRIQRQEKSDLWPNQELEKRWAIREFVR